jgi:hypothetical protein
MIALEVRAVWCFPRRSSQAVFIRTNGSWAALFDWRRRRARGSARGDGGLDEAGARAIVCSHCRCLPHALLQRRKSFSRARAGAPGGSRFARSAGRHSRSSGSAALDRDRDPISAGDRPGLALVGLARGGALCDEHAEYGKVLAHIADGRAIDARGVSVCSGCGAGVWPASRPVAVAPRAFRRR